MTRREMRAAHAAAIPVPFGVRMAIAVVASHAALFLPFLL